MRFYMRGKARRERNERIHFKPKECEWGRKKKKRGKKNAKRGEFGTLSKVKLNYYIVLIDANDVRIIMIIVIILTIGNSPILSISIN